MSPNPPANAMLTALSNVRAFIIYRASDKSPIDPTHSHPATSWANSNAQDRATWLLPSEAQAYAAMLGAGYGVGLVLHPELKIFCVDIDGAIVNGQWSPLALEFFTLLAGCAIEVSMSNTGGHIFGSYTGDMPPHMTKNTARHIELYHELRYIALTGTSLLGNVMHDCTALLPQFIAEYFAKDEADGPPVEWTPEPLWHVPGTSDDAELIAKACRSQSTVAIYGDGVKFKDLWDCNVDKLAGKWPPSASSKSGLSYNGNSADQSLANRLVWWTGGDCERTERIMRDSGMSRDKWDNRPGYLPETILKALRLVAKNPPTDNRSAMAPLPANVPVGTQVAPPPPVAGEASVLTMNRKMQFDATLEALVYVLGKQTQASIGFDEFRGRVMIAPAGTEEWRPLTDTDMIQLRETLAREQRFAPIGKELMRDALQLVAERHCFDSAITWLNGLHWDGVPRIERFLPTYCGTVDDEYTRAVGLYIWTGLAGRVLEPGCQLDMVVAFKSPQGRMKSTGFQAMVPVDDCFTDGLSLHEDDDDFKRLIRGKLVIEVAEMAGLSKGDINLVKRVITRRVEEWIEKFQTLPTRFKRRGMLFASTNDDQFLPPDETGQRRWLPVEITALDRVRIAADRDQLWAEGAQMWRSGVGDDRIRWRDAEALAKGRHVKYEQTDVWEAAIEGWLDRVPPIVPGTVSSPPPRSRPLTLSDILTGAIGLNTAHQDARAEKRAARVMRQLGFEVRIVRLDGISKPCRRWVPRE